ncbi:MAG: hypothetical protein RIQ53_2623 [Pseudomonadota bacterium]|jgi:hypothetical protein
MDLLAMVRRAWVESGKAGSGPTTLDGASREAARIAGWINDEWQALGAETWQDWRFLKRRVTVTIPPLQRALLPGELGLTDWTAWRPDSKSYHPQAVAPDGRPYPLWWCSLDAWHRTFGAGTWADGEPVCWCIGASGELMIGPGLDAERQVLIEYVATPNELAADGDQPAMPERHHMLLVWAALVQSAAQTGDAALLARAQTNRDRLRTALDHDQAAQLSVAGSLA